MSSRSVADPGFYLWHDLGAVWKGGGFIYYQKWTLTIVRETSPLNFFPLDLPGSASVLVLTTRLRFQQAGSLLFFPIAIMKKKLKIMLKQWNMLNAPLKWREWRQLTNYPHSWFRRR